MASFTSKILTHELDRKPVLFETSSKPAFTLTRDLLAGEYKRVESKHERKVVVTITLPCGATAVVDPEELLRAAKALNQ